MKPNLLDILSHQEVPIDSKKLNEYLTGKMDSENEHAIEKEMMQSSELESDAWDGWQQASHKKNILRDAEDINRKLAQQLQPATKRTPRKPIREMPLNWWLLGLLLVLLVGAYFIIAAIMTS